MNLKQSEIEKRIDIVEAEIEPQILARLLEDKTTGKNILWATTDYEEKGFEFKETSEITIECVAKRDKRVVQPRAAKAKEIQELRIKKKAEVFTPSWVCNEQNNLVDEAWFGRKNVFNTPNGMSWDVTKGKIEFGKKKWQRYVRAKRLEMTCGEAPYLVSRYDTTTGKEIPLYERIGLFDRKMRIVNENCESDEDWQKWSIIALQSIYGYEFQGDSVLIARENLYYDYLDYYRERFKNEPSSVLKIKIANIIAWNIWQMDGLRCVVPYSCHEEEEKTVSSECPELTNFVCSESSLSMSKLKPCPGCKENNILKHNGIYCRIFDWTNKNQSIDFKEIFKNRNMK